MHRFVANGLPAPRVRSVRRLAPWQPQRRPDGAVAAHRIRQIMQSNQQEGAAKTRVLILGGGFAGLYAAMYLDRKLARRPDVDVMLISRENYFVFQPMLPEIISSHRD